jgi:KipI family sensor histidine kinase inhibitor
MERHRYGPEAWLLDDVDDPAGVAAGIVGARHPGVVDVVPADSTVVVRCTRATAAAIGALLDAVSPAPSAGDDHDTLTIEVVYDGEDLDAVAAAARIPVDEVIERHVAGEYTVAFCGFSPGFGYLRGLDPVLHVPRRDVPRTLVPAGSVAIAAGYAAVYPRASPGGWHLLGRTDRTLWNPHADPPAEMRPGRTVRFRRST